MMMMMMIIYVDIFPSNSNMKRPSARSRRGQQHRCAVCGSLKHRLETCPYPGATLVKKLKGQLKSKSSRLEPKHPDARLHVRAGTKWQKEARKGLLQESKVREATEAHRLQLWLERFFEWWSRHGLAMWSWLSAETENMPWLFCQNAWWSLEARSEAR